MAHISTMEKLGIPAPGFSLPNLNSVIKGQTVSLDEKIEGLHFKDANIKQTMKELIA